MKALRLATAWALALVLAASTSKDGPGPLVSTFAGSPDHAIPVTIVPGGLTDDAIDALT